MATSSTTLTMAEQLVPNEVGAAIQPLLPPKRPHPKAGRPWIGDRAVLAGIIYVLRAGVPWRRIARRGVESSTRLGRQRWKVERSLAWLLAKPAADRPLRAPRRPPDRVPAPGPGR